MFLKWKNAKKKKSQLLFLNDILILIAYGMHKICRVGYSFIWSYISPMASASATLHSRKKCNYKKTTIKIVYEKMTVPIRKSLKFLERNMKDFFFFFCVYFARRVVQCNFLHFLYTAHIENWIFCFWMFKVQIQFVLASTR